MSLLDAVESAVDKPSLRRRLILNAIDVLVLVACAAIAWFDTGIMRWSCIACMVYLGCWKLHRLLLPVLSTAAIDRLTSDETSRLLERRRVAELWLADMCAARSVRRRPRLLIALTGFASYAPFGHTISIPPSHLTSLPDEDLRLVVAHELGHAQRRWISTWSFSVIAKMKEEILADRFALDVTGSDPAAWVRVMRAVAALEENGLGDDDAEFEIRRRAVVAWYQRRAARPLAI